MLTSIAGKQAIIRRRVTVIHANISMSVQDPMQMMIKLLRSYADIILIISKGGRKNGFN